MDLTVAGIGREVRRRITEGMSPKDAADATAREFVGDENGKLRAMLDSGLLAFAFREAEAETLRSDPMYAGGGDQSTLDDQRGDETPARTRYDAFHARPFDVVVPVATTGVRKRLGDFTAKDAMAVRNYYRAASETMRNRSNAWGRVAKKIGDGTLEDAWMAIAEDDRKQIAA